jgi:cytochrome c oxidase assembly protein subunit 15
MVAVLGAPRADDASICCVGSEQGMSIEEFKSIYFWEWFHRMWGRSLGVLFAVPAAFFVARRPTRNAIKQLRLYPRLGLLFGLGGLQGLVGWWMVKSGLDHTHILGIERDKDDMPKVSPYRLATHLSFAFVTYGLLAWTSMGLLSDPAIAVAEAKRLATLSPKALKSLRRFRTGVHGAASLMGLTIVSGAFVAGNLAGLV